MKEVFISHPGIQHSHQLAWALHEKGLLHAFWSGVPVTSVGETLPFWLPNTYAKRVKTVEIPPELRRHPVFFQAILRAGLMLPSNFSREDYSHRVFHFFDWWVSKHIKQMQPKVVVAYENSAYHTFRAAKAIGARCILDASSLHHSAAEKFITVKKTPYLAEINRRKDCEVELADLILTCSPFAADSYIAARVPPEKVKSVLLGAELSHAINAWQTHNQPLHFIFAGGIRYLKAIDLILAVFKRLNNEALPYKLSFIGDEGEQDGLRQLGKLPMRIIKAVLLNLNSFKNWRKQTVCCYHHALIHLAWW